MVVGSFHGHAHNRGCQVNWHPLHVKGMGHANFEGCERVFLSSNHLAPGTHHASTFHRHQAIEEHFAFWDEDKYAGIGLCLIFDTLQVLRAYLQVPFCLITVVKLSRRFSHFQRSFQRSAPDWPSVTLILRVICRMSGHTF